MKLCFFIFAFLLLMEKFVFADDYFNALAQIQKPPMSAVPIQPCSIAEKKQVLTLMTQDKVSLMTSYHLKMDHTGFILDSDNQSYEIYKGDFSNNGLIEYAVISTGGSGNYNTVSVYKLINHQLQNMHIDKVISRDLLNGDDLSNFYGFTAKPFAVVKDGVTYIRFMDFPGDRSYDKTKLHLCTYLWKNNKIVLSEPNLAFSPITGKMINFDNCIH